MPRSKLSPSRLHAAERRAHVFRLRQSGATFDDIALTLHRDPHWQGRLPKTYTRAEVWRDVQAELDRIRTTPELVEAVRELELARLDRMALAIWPRALGSPAYRTADGATIPAVPADLQAQGRILDIMARRAKYVPHLEVLAKSLLDPLATLAGLLGVDKGELPAPASPEDDEQPSIFPAHGDLDAADHD